MSRTELSRRTFLKASGSAGALIVTLGAPVFARTRDGQTIPLNAWVKIASDNIVTIMVSQAEMGQGVQTTLPAIIAEELDADWDLVRREMTPVDLAYANPNFGSQFTGNAESTRTFWPLLRNMGASAREMLLTAAAQELNVDREFLRTEKSFVIQIGNDGRSDRRIPYGALAAGASALPLPKKPKLKDPSDWTLLRRSLGRVEIKEKVTGAPIFGIDVEVDGMVYAAIEHAPEQYGIVKRIDKASATNIDGVLDVVELPGAVAVVARSYWQSRKGLAALSVEYGAGDIKAFDTDSLRALYRATMDGSAWSISHDEGDAPAVIAAADEDKVLSSEYWSAWQAHAAMEPMNCTASVTDSGIEIWAPTQGQTMVVVRVAEALGVAPETIQVNRTFLGGGFGRRLIADYAVQAALVSRAIGRPVKIIWSREEDIRHDHYRPGVMHHITAAIDDDGYPEAFDQRIVSPTILSPVIPNVPEPRLVYPATDPSSLEGAHDEGFRYGIEAQRLRSHSLDVPVKTMVWRTTGYGPNVFAIESYIDELAHRVGADPLDYRRTLLKRGKDNDRALAVLDMLADKSKWAERPQGRAKGLAFSFCFDTFIAQSAEVSVDEDGTLDIHKIITVLDGGYVLDPDLTEANIQGGIVWGLSQALISEITFTDSAVDQSNWHNYQILELAETPPTEFYFIDSGAKPGGLGEVGPVPTTPALTNAIFAATGRRIRTLPLSRAGIHTRYRKQFV